MKMSKQEPVTLTWNENQRNRLTDKKKPVAIKMFKNIYEKYGERMKKWKL